MQTSWSHISSFLLEPNSPPSPLRLEHPITFMDPHAHSPAPNSFDLDLQAAGGGCSCLRTWGSSQASQQLRSLSGGFDRWPRSSRRRDHARVHLLTVSRGWLPGLSAGCIFRLHSVWNLYSFGFLYSYYLHYLDFSRVEVQKNCLLSCLLPCKDAC